MENESTCTVLIVVILFTSVTFGAFPITELSRAADRFLCLCERLFIRADNNLSGIVYKDITLVSGRGITTFGFVSEYA